MFIVDVPMAIISSMFFSSIFATIFSVIFILAAILITASEEFAIAYFAFFVYIALMAIFTPINPFMFVWHNPTQAFGFIVGYFAIGSIYSTIKYWSFVKKMVNVIKECKKQFILNNKLPISVRDEIPETWTTRWSDFKYHELNGSDRRCINSGLRPAQNVDMIMNWIAFWPFSAIGLFVADPLKHLVTSIYQHLVSIYGKMYEKIVSSNINMKDL